MYINICKLHDWETEANGLLLVTYLQTLGTISTEYHCPQGHGPMKLVYNNGFKVALRALYHSSKKKKGIFFESQHSVSS